MGIVILAAFGGCLETPIHNTKVILGKGTTSLYVRIYSHSPGGSVAERPADKIGVCANKFAPTRR